MQVLGRRHLEVVVAGDRHRDRGRAGERRHDHVELRPDQAAGRHRPALGRPEQADQALAGGRVVGAPGRLDHHLDRERDHVHLAPARLGHLQVEHEHRRRRVAHRRALPAPRTRARARRVEGSGRRRAGGLRAHARTASAWRPVEERRHRLLHRRAAGQALPVRLDRAGERVAAVDRRDGVRRRVGQAVHDQPLDVGLEPLEHRVQLDHPAPGCEVQLALGRAGRARVERDDAPGGGRVHEEGEPDRDLEARPDVVGQLDVGQPLRAAARSAGTPHRPSAAPSSSRRRTRSALHQVQQVAVVAGDARAAEVAPLRRRRSASVGAGGRTRPRRPGTTCARRRAATASATSRRPDAGFAPPGAPVLAPFSVTSPAPP